MIKDIGLIFYYSNLLSMVLGIVLLFLGALKMMNFVIICVIVWGLLVGWGWFKLDKLNEVKK